MALPDCAIIILAAGKGTRLKSSVAKVLHRAGGLPLIEHVVRACQRLKPRAIVIDDHRLPGRVSIVGVARHPIETVLRPQFEPFIVAMLVDEFGLEIEELLDTFTQSRHWFVPV